jgi:hypothetical protein
MLLSKPEGRKLIKEVRREVLDSTFLRYTAGSIMALHGEVRTGYRSHGLSAYLDLAICIPLHT